MTLKTIRKRYIFFENANVSISRSLKNRIITYTFPSILNIRSYNIREWMVSMNQAPYPYYISRKKWIARRWAIRSWLQLVTWDSAELVELSLCSANVCMERHTDRTKDKTFAPAIVRVGKGGRDVWLRARGKYEDFDAIAEKTYR